MYDLEKMKENYKKNIEIETIKLQKRCSDDEIEIHIINNNRKHFKKDMISYFVHNINHLEELVDIAIDNYIDDELKVFKFKNLREKIINKYKRG